MSLILDGAEKKWEVILPQANLLRARSPVQSFPKRACSFTGFHGTNNFFRSQLHPTLRLPEKACLYLFLFPLISGAVAKHLGIHSIACLQVVTSQFPGPITVCRLTWSQAFKPALVTTYRKRGRRQLLISNCSHTWVARSWKQTPSSALCLSKMIHVAQPENL